MSYMGISQNYGYLFGGKKIRNYSIKGSILGSTYFGQLSYRAQNSTMGTPLDKYIPHGYKDPLGNMAQNDVNA